ncbi:hypothetical protein ASG65_20860 [Bacillus sp. Leaf13]|nr:hypothetical protein ASG65_20860 [Bacillus sp. Leaf13]
MANIKVIFIQSVSHATYNDEVPGKSYAIYNVYDLVDTVANDYIAKDWAIPFVGYETNPKRPAVIRYPK